MKRYQISVNHVGRRWELTVLEGQGPRNSALTSYKPVAHWTVDNADVDMDDPFADLLAELYQWANDQRESRRLSRVRRLPSGVETPYLPFDA